MLLCYSNDIMGVFECVYSRSSSCTLRVCVNEVGCMACSQQKLTASLSGSKENTSGHRHSNVDGGIRDKHRLKHSIV